MKYVYLTVDLEEWYELDYLKNYKLDQSVEVIPEIIDFLDLLDQFQIKATFFVLATALNKNTDIVKEINRRGHAIGCHGLDHELLYNKGTNQFINEVVKAKKDIEKSVDCEVNGYRASCFSMERDKLDALFHAGFQYDSSFIKFEQHTLYRNLDLKGFEQKDALVYINDGFIEYEIPTLKITVCTSCSSIQMRQNFFSLFISFIFLTPSYFNLLSVSLFLYPSLAAVAAIWPAREDTNDLILVISDI
jgi:hypothetical protein